MQTNTRPQPLNIANKLPAFRFYLIAGLFIGCSLVTYGQQWKLSWSDDFNGAAGQAVDSAKWSHETGGSGFGNKELQFYTTGVENSSLDGKGHLVIKALAEANPDKKCWYGPCLYTSARLTTRNSLAQTYGRFEARMKLPAGEGVWPAFWMLGNNIRNGGWPACGEIDIMENIGREPSVVHGTIHGPGYSGKGSIGGPFEFRNKRKFADDFHVFAVEWEPEKIRWYVDDVLYETRTPTDLPNGTHWVYDHSFFVILNLAIGGAWPGSPNKDAVFPKTMLVDYVRVYERAP